MFFDVLFIAALMSAQSVQLEADEIPFLPVTIRELEPLTAQVKRRIAEVRRRYVAAQNLAKRPGGDPESRMVAAAALNYELGLFALGKGPTAAAAAAAYVTALEPCYEWEGMPDCPERDAQFAEAQIAKGSRAFGDYLPLLAAHSWLCVADFAKSDDARARAAAMFALAAKSGDPLARAAAVVLEKRASCYPKTRAPGPPPDPWPPGS
jgi:hypothetical protein